MSRSQDIREGAGKTLAVVTLLASQIRQIATDEIAHARRMVVTA